MEDLTMTKKEYMKPTMETVQLHQHCQILAGSLDANGMNDTLQEETVTDGWAPMYDEIGLGF
jgi:hypothetical protein